MKKFLYTVMLLAGVAMFSACDHEFLGPKDSVGGSAVEALSGEWYVSVDLIDEDGNVVYEDPYGMGRILIMTYNTADNKSDELVVSDNGNFWEFAVTTNCNLKNKSFSCDAVEAYDGCDVTIWDGKILPGKGHQNNGSVADSIAFNIMFSDDNPDTYYRMSGVRYSGLAEND